MGSGQWEAVYSLPAPKPGPWVVPQPGKQLAAAVGMAEESFPTRLSDPEKAKTNTSKTPEAVSRPLSELLTPANCWQWLPLWTFAFHSYFLRQRLDVWSGDCRRSWFLNLGTIGIWGQIVHCRVFSSICGLYPISIRSSNPFPSCQMFPGMGVGVGNQPWLKTTGIDRKCPDLPKEECRDG